MRKLGMIVVLAVAGLAVACGGSSSASGDSGADGATQGTAGAGGSGGTAGAGGGAGGGTSGSCNAPSCLTSLYSSCEPSGTCVSQTDTTTFATNSCYSNGVKEIMTIALSGIAITYKKGTSTCYSINIDSTGAISFKNAAGSVVATGTYDSTTTATTVTCTGGQAVTVNSSCDSSTMGGTSAPDCTQGTCTP